MRCLLLLAVVGMGSAALAADEKYVTIKGQVTWNGKAAPAPELIQFKGHADQKVCCKAGPLVSSQIEVDPKTLGLKNVVVYFRPDDTDKEKTFPLDKVKPNLAKPKSKEHVIDQPTCQFEPRMTVARAGDTLVVKNSATIAHNVNYSSADEQMNPLLPAGGEVKLKNALVAQRTSIIISCNIHPWMTGQVRVFDHPYYAITDKDGKFEIKDVPAGTWRIVYFHETGYHQSKPKENVGHLGFPMVIGGDKATLELDAIKFQLRETPGEKK